MNINLFTLMGEKAMFCNNCGNPVNEGSKFCGGCGTRIEAVQAQAPPEPDNAMPQATEPGPEQDYAPPQVQGYPPEQEQAQPEAPHYPQEPAYAPPQDQGYPPEQEQAQPQPQAPYYPQGQGYDQPQPPPYPPGQGYAQPQATIYPPGQNPQQQYPNPAAGYSPPGYEYPPGAGPWMHENDPYGAGDAPQKKGKKKLLLIVIPVAALVLIAAAAFIFLYLRSTPMLTVSRALSNFEAEMSERIDATPLVALQLISDSISNSTITAGFDYQDYYLGRYRGESVLSFNTKDRAYAMELDISIQGQVFDVELLVDKERIAAGSRFIDNNHYGIRYSTFRDDIRVFGNLVGLDRYTMDTLSDAVELFGDLVNMDDGAFNDIFGNYSEAIEAILKDFLNSVELTSERDTVSSGGDDVRCTRIDMLINEDALLDLLYDYYELLEDDEFFSELIKYFDSDLTRDIYREMRNAHSDFLWEFRDVIREFERNFSGDIVLSFFVGSKDRLLRVELNADVTFDRNNSVISGFLDLGSSALDLWEMEMSVTERGSTETVSATWNYRERSGSIENILTFSAGYMRPITMSSVWSPERGDFTLSYDDGWGKQELSGVFTVEGKGFYLSFDDLLVSYYTGGRLTLEFWFDPGSQIRQVDFINIDRWDFAILERFVSAFDSVGF